MIAQERWRDNWKVVSPAGAVRVDLHRSLAERRASKQKVRDLSPGTPVVLFASAPGAIRRCRAFASDMGVELEREYLAFPSTDAPAYLVEDAPAPVRVFVSTVLVVPPRAALSTPIAAALSLLRAWKPWQVVRRIAPGRVAVGRKS